MTHFLSGIQPTGLPHLGNYFGAMEQHINISRTLKPGDEAFFFIADLHALTTMSDPQALDENVRGVAASYVALGLDTEKVAFFRQSDIPEVCELAWMLSCVTGTGLLERAHSYKDKTSKGITPSVGLFTYPILMAADIVIYDADVVPVGKDQIQHIEMAQDMVGHFNARFGPCLRRPEWTLSTCPRVPGTNGDKMSKSYGNTIGLFSEGAALKKEINSIVTDSRTPAEPKDPESVNAYLILELFLSEEEKGDWRRRLISGGVGYGDVKKELTARIESRFGAARARYNHLLRSAEGQKELEGILEHGAVRARRAARATLARCMEAVGLLNSARRLRA